MTMVWDPFSQCSALFWLLALSSTWVVTFYTTTGSPSIAWFVRDVYGFRFQLVHYNFSSSNVSVWFFLAVWLTLAILFLFSAFSWVFHHRTCRASLCLAVCWQKAEHICAVLWRRRKGYVVYTKHLTSREMVAACSYTPSGTCQISAVRLICTIPESCCGCLGAGGCRGQCG